jgi:hypothetical protein
MTDKDYSPHEDWCDTQNNISTRCNCMVSGYIEKIEDLRESLKLAVETLASLLSDTQHNEHKCNDLRCPVEIAKNTITTIKAKHDKIE